MTEKKLPPLALGAWSWGTGMAGGDQVFGNHYFEDDLRPVFDKAVEKGLTLWDTAAVYGEGTSERILGNFVKDVPREDVLISTKFTPQIAGPGDDAMEKMLEGSLSHLHTDYVDIYWIHNPMDVERWTKDLIPLAKSGKIRKIAGNPGRRRTFHFRHPEPLQSPAPLLRKSRHPGLLQRAWHHILLLHGIGAGRALRKVRRSTSIS